MHILICKYNCWRGKKICKTSFWVRLQLYIFNLRPAWFFSLAMYWLLCIVVKCFSSKTKLSRLASVKRECFSWCKSFTHILLITFRRKILLVLLHVQQTWVLDMGLTTLMCFLVAESLRESAIWYDKLVSAEHCFSLCFFNAYFI